MSTELGIRWSLISNKTNIRTLSCFPWWHQCFEIPQSLRVNKCLVVDKHGPGLAVQQSFEIEGNAKRLPLAHDLVAMLVHQWKSIHDIDHGSAPRGRRQHPSSVGRWPSSRMLSIPGQIPSYGVLDSEEPPLFELWRQKGPVDKLAGNLEKILKRLTGSTLIG